MALRRKIKALRKDKLVHRKIDMRERELTRENGTQKDAERGGRKAREAG